MQEDSNLRSIATPQSLLHLKELHFVDLILNAIFLL